MDREREKLVDLLREFDTGFLVTRTEEGTLHGRPMAVADVRDNGTLYFAADLHSPKVAELENDAGVGVFFQSKNRWISLAGVAVVVHDRSLIDELWSESWKVWFPKGKDDPSVCLIEVLPSSGEYWDQSGAQGIQYSFEAIKAYMTGEPPSTNRSHNAKVAL
jgi:general stress protein 26